MAASGSGHTLHSNDPRSQFDLRVGLSRNARGLDGGSAVKGDTPESAGVATHTTMVYHVLSSEWGFGINVRGLEEDSAVKGAAPESAGVARHATMVYHACFVSIMLSASVPDP